MMVGTSVVVSTWGVAGTTWSSVMTASTAFALVASLWGLLGSLLLASLLAQHSEVIIATACVALLTFCRTFSVGMGVTTLLAAMCGGSGQCIHMLG